MIEARGASGYRFLLFIKLCYPNGLMTRLFPLFITPMLLALGACTPSPLAVESAKSTELVAVTQTESEEPSPPAKPKRKLIAGKYKIKATHSGKMSWYSVKTNGGTVTASGERFKDAGLTAAHRTLKFGSKVRVTNLRNGNTEIVRITDRGPFIKERIIDVSIGTARRLGFVSHGVVKCKVDVLTEPS
jgi:rare lipoprotein A